MAMSIYGDTATHGFVTNLTPSAAQQSAQAWDAPIEVLHLKENELIFKEGEAPRGLYFLKSGAVKTVVNRRLTRGRIASPEYINKVVAPGEFFGYKALIKGTNYQFFAKTLRASEIHVFSKETFHQIMNGPNSVMKMVLLQMIRDLENNESVGQLHYLASVQERIAYQILLLADKFGAQTTQGLSLNLRLTRNELAQLAGTINESLSRHLTEFKNEGIIDLNGKEIIVKNRQALMARSGNFT
ncbi:MAG: Crp/Fnr family transcriptional regulator [Pseudobdellovibrionaceae bacterium]|jgi:CRP/FNR family cyclic AMP-dependent transcriptional regulator